MMKVCARQGCRVLCPVGQVYCPAHGRERSAVERGRDDARRSDDEARGWYGSDRWRRQALAQLRAAPLCARCEALGLAVAAEVADHVVPHAGDEDAFWSGALQSLCHPCHNGWKRRAEARWKRAPGPDTRQGLRAGG